MKKPTSRKPAVFVIAAALLLMGAVLVIARTYEPLGVLNLTASLPRGLYAFSSRPVEKDAFVVFDLPESNPVHELAAKRGYTPPGHKLHKRVAALPGEAYTLPPVSPRDAQGRPMRAFQPVRGVVPQGMAVVLGNSTNSFDSRYYGPVPLDALRVVVPLLIEKETSK